jgi:hypothetical protein
VEVVLVQEQKASNHWPSPVACVESIDLPVVEEDILVVETPQEQRLPVTKRAVLVALQVDELDPAPHVQSQTAFLSHFYHSPSLMTKDQYDRGQSKELDLRKSVLLQVGSNFEQIENVFRQEAPEAEGLGLILFDNGPGGSHGCFRVLLKQVTTTHLVMHDCFKEMAMKYPALVPYPSRPPAPRHWRRKDWALPEAQVLLINIGPGPGVNNPDEILSSGRYFSNASKRRPFQAAAADVTSSFVLADFG